MGESGSGRRTQQSSAPWPRQSRRCPLAATRIMSAFCAGVCRGFRKQTIAFADEQVTGIQRYRHAILLVQRLLAVALRILVLDVVMDQRRLMKAFDGYGDFADVRAEAAPRAYPAGPEKPPPSGMAASASPRG